MGQREANEMTYGVPQASKIALLLWNIMYDGIFHIGMHEKATVIGYADDIEIVVMANTDNELKHRRKAIIEEVAN